ncbi:unnamed protein product [Caenorhabditis angaria]|uniref:Uncharacterized protein n=1 Tax=Caenorhabditis angaria TaxID=860376 RepID=A0A9P1N4Z3_9PELO|nr:unnamed protein product [Caenorhabditis angaria]
MRDSLRKSSNPQSTERNEKTELAGYSTQETTKVEASSNIEQSELPSGRVVESEVGTSIIEKESKHQKVKEKEKTNDLHDDAFIRSIIINAIDNVVGDAAFTPVKTAGWAKEIVKTITAELMKNGEQRKFVVHATLLPIGDGKSMSSVTQCYWNELQDNAHFYRWQSLSTIGLINIFFMSHHLSRAKMCTIL